MAPFNRPFLVNNTVRFCILQNNTCSKSRSQLDLSSVYIQLDKAVCIFKTQKKLQYNENLHSSVEYTSGIRLIKVK